MERVCEYCGNAYDPTSKRCPHCGTPNRDVDRNAPKTIEELRAYCEERQIDLHRLRFFLGEDCREARIYGIYRAEDGKYVVYKNHSDGERSEACREEDEAVAVAVLYAKLHRALHSRSRSSQRSGRVQVFSASDTEIRRRRKRRKRRTLRKAVMIAAVAVALLIFVILLFSAKDTTQEDPQDYAPVTVVPE